MVSTGQDSATVCPKDREEAAGSTVLTPRARRLSDRSSLDVPRVSCQLSDGAFVLCGQVPCWKVDRYCLRLKVFLNEREDISEVCRTAVRHGGVKIREYCFSYRDESQWRAALDALQKRFGPHYFEAFDTAESLCQSCSD
jgi:hypothetical protein